MDADEGTGKSYKVSGDVMAELFVVPEVGVMSGCANNDAEISAMWTNDRPRDQKY